MRRDDVHRLGPALRGEVGAIRELTQLVDRPGDQLQLRVELSRRQDADLDLVLVTPEHSVYAGTYPPDQGFDTLLSEQMREWMDQGLALVPDDVTARGVVIRAESNAEGLIRAAEDTEASLIVIGASSRGLAARFSVGNVARGLLHAAPVPVALDVQLRDRPPPAVESTAYFVVAEALTNVARHSGATRANVAVARSGDRLVVEVRDNGRGGADASRGSGLQGLRDRVSGLGGSMFVISPEGGPTTISVELPCGS